MTCKRLKEQKEGGECVCVCVCVCACPCLSLPPRLRQIEGRSALRSKPPHHLPPTPQPSVCVCVLSFSLARCVCLTAGCTSWFVWHYHARNHAIMPIAGRVCELHHALCACVCVCRSCENVCSPVCVHMCELKCVLMAVFDTRVIMGDMFVCTGVSQSAFVFVLPVFSHKLTVTHLHKHTNT